MIERAQRVEIRRGLPRVKGGEAWPPATEVEVPGVAAVTADPTPVEASGAPAESASAGTASAGAATAGAAGAATAGAVTAASEVAPGEPAAAQDQAAAPSPAAGAGVPLRRGLPRVSGGEPWPPASVATPIATSVAPDLDVDAKEPVAAAVAPVAAAVVADAVEAPVQARAEIVPSTASEQPVATLAGDGVPLRRGLPRVSGGEPWPPAGVARAVAVQEPGTAQEGGASAPEAAPAGIAAQAPASGRTAVATVARPDVSTPLSFTRTVWQGVAPRHAAEAVHPPSKLRPTWPQAIGGLLGLAALGLVAVAGVFLVRALLSTPAMQDFLAAYPGEYHVDVEPGFAPWVGWQHFLNMFLMVLIIRSGLRVRTEKRPTAFWTARGRAKSKISLTLWFHQALDLLWMVNGLVFVVLLFATGHWLRLVPTSWEVFPNALSAGLQYVSFDWPTDNGWVNYNSLQQLAYFTTVFLAAPLAAVTGFRMSGLWPKKAEKLSKAYPVEWARALHFPVMLYFVAFITVHVALVFLTGALRNLNHMFAAQGSVDGAEYASNWTGFMVFMLAVAVIAAGWYAARPLVLAPIAKLFGQVSGR